MLNAACGLFLVKMTRCHFRNRGFFLFSPKLNEAVTKTRAVFSAFNELHRGIFSGGGGVPRMTALDHIHSGGTGTWAGSLLPLARSIKTPVFHTTLIDRDNHHPSRSFIPLLVVYVER